ncbi:nucleoside-diphosphate-sugar epimerase [Kribbella amoyensis]|uniref:Nucleoside-diphosphate-sugar epimerase n=1 Tax=Kribbella amoyensis TaxID=996641 RepID=A0A561B2Y0_9ACTN|nr:NAD(P)-dependent oxidoreductase [Kribbella amoyensis]TWD73218.1 nucleoside-diphosphate-sugar epimerase [Kribbella amoyensis]
MFEDEAALEAALATPSADLVADLGRLEGDLVVLGAGGKMGPSLCLLARRALDEAGGRHRRVLAVSRWSDQQVRAGLEAVGVTTVAFDLLSDDSFDELPDAANVVFMVGAKFGTSGAPGRLWQTNSVVAGLAAARYRDARIAAFSTGNVYPLVPITEGGSTEADQLGPVGEYAMSCLGRERVFGYAAETWGTPLSVIRLNYAVEPRYGVLADVFSQVRDGIPVDVTTGAVNVVWQRYANEVALRSLLHATPEQFVLNLTGPETLSVRELAVEAGRRLGVEPEFKGTEAPTALLNDASRCHELFGLPDAGIETLLDWQADWIARGGVVWDKPTKFQVRDGKF